MSTLLHIEASPRKTRSASLEVARGFIERFSASLPAVAALKVKTLDLWSGALPEFGADALEAKYAGLAGTPLDAAQQSAWQTLRELAAGLHEADVIVLSVPLWNFGIPYKLKQFIDLVSQKDILFTFDPERGLEGMLRGKTAVAVYARGLDYDTQSASGTPAAQFDLQRPYVEMWLKFIGVTDVHAVVVQKTLFGAQVDRDARDAAIRDAQALAERIAQTVGQTIAQPRAG